MERLAQEREAVETRMKMIEATADESKSGAAESERLRMPKPRPRWPPAKPSTRRPRKAAETLEEALSAHKTAIIEMMNRQQEQKTAQTRQATMLSQMEARKAELERRSLAGEQPRRKRRFTKRLSRRSKT